LGEGDAAELTHGLILHLLLRLLLAHGRVELRELLDGVHVDGESGLHEHVGELAVHARETVFLKSELSKC